VPAKFYYALTEQGQLARQLRQSGVQLDLPSNAPAKPAQRRPEVNGDTGAKTARIDQDEEEGSDEALSYAFEEYDAYEGFPAEDLEFVLRGREEILERGEKSKLMAESRGHVRIVYQASLNSFAIRRREGCCRFQDRSACRHSSKRLPQDYRFEVSLS
jgi:hypothetical protein